VKLVLNDLNGTHARAYSNGDKAEFTEDERIRATCIVNGSYPQPDVKVMAGEKDITDLFTRKDVLKKVGATVGLQELYYEVTLTNNDMTIAYEFDQKQLQCVASMPKTPFAPNSLAVNVSLTGCE
jgi:hypothetical protein